MANTPLQPLSLGNVVSAGFRLYRDRFSTYLPIAIRASLWSLMPFVFLLLILLISALISFQLGNGTQVNFSTFGLAIFISSIIFIFLLCFCSAKSITNLALISRLAFGMLTNKPETVKQASAHVMPKLWKFLWASILVFLRIFAIWFLVPFFLGLLIGLFGPSLSNTGSWIIFGALLLIFFGAYWIFMIRFLLRFTLMEVPLAIENNLTASQTIQRSWDLTEKYVGKVFTIFLVVFLISLPLQFMANLCSSLIEQILKKILALDPESPLLLALSLVIGIIVGTVFAVFLLPLYQTVKATIYYDLRSRKEGLDIQLSND